MAVRRGEIYWADLDPVVGSEQGGRRPVLVLQANAINRHAKMTIVLAVTSQAQRAAYPLTVKLEEGEGGLPKASWVKTNQMRTLALSRLETRLGKLSAKRLMEVEKALLEVLDVQMA